MFRPTLFALGFIAALPGCSALSALDSSAKPLDNYDITAPVNGPRASGRATSRQIVVELPAAAGALNNERILIRPNPLQAAYLPDAQWSEELPVMLQTVMVRSLEDSNAFRYVGRRPLGGSGDYALVTEITDFEAEVAPDNSKTATVQMRLTARLIREVDASVVASRTFTASRPTGSVETLELVQAFNSASQEVMTDLTAWVLSTLRIPARRAG